MLKMDPDDVRELLRRDPEAVSRRTKLLGENCLHRLASRKVRGGEAELRKLREVIMICVNHGAEIEGRSSKGFTPLQCAARAGNVTALKCLLSAGASVDVYNRGLTLLHLAAAGGHSAVIEALMPELANHINDEAEDGRTALSIACRGGHGDAVQVLIRHGAVAEEKHLTLASGSGDAECVEIVRSVGNIPVSAGAILKAEKCGHPAVVRRLLLPPIAASISASTLALIQAAEAGQISLSRSIIDSVGAPLAVAHPPNANGACEYALHGAARGGACEIMARLLELGSDPSACAVPTGRTPLMEACIGGHYDACVLLLKNAADASAKDSAGITALDFCLGQKDCDPRLIMALLDHDARTSPLLLSLRTAMSDGFASRDARIRELEAQVHTLKNAAAADRRDAAAYLHTAGQAVTSLHGCLRACIEKKKVGSLAETLTSVLRTGFTDARDEDVVQDGDDDGTLRAEENGDDGKKEKKKVKKKRLSKVQKAENLESALRRAMEIYDGARARLVSHFNL